MPVSKTHAKKSPNQKPTSFYKLEQFGGAEGSESQSVGDKLTGGPMMEKIYGRKTLATQTLTKKKIT